MDIEKFLEAMKRKVNVDMDDQACAEAMAGLEAYYKVCFTRRHCKVQILKLFDNR